MALSKLAPAFTSVDKRAGSKLDQVLQVQDSIDANLEEVFGSSIDEPVEEQLQEDEADEDMENEANGSAAGSNKSGRNINDVSIDSIKLAQKQSKQVEQQLELEKEFENQMKVVGFELRDASQEEDASGQE